MGYINNSLTTSETIHFTALNYSKSTELTELNDNATYIAHNKKKEDDDNNDEVHVPQGVPELPIVGRGCGAAGGTSPQLPPAPGDEDN